MIKLMAVTAFVSLAAGNLAHASTGVAYKVDCLVYTTSSPSKVIARGQVAVSSGQDLTILKKGNLEYLAGATETVLPNKEITRQIVLTIKKYGEVIAQSMTDFDPAKPSNAILSAEYSKPTLSCNQAQ